MQVIQYALAIWSWVFIAMLVAFMWRIAYFYQKTSGQRVGHPLILVPALLLAAGAVMYLVCDIEFTGNYVADLLLLGGGLSLIGFGLRLQELMTGERR